MLKIKTFVFNLFEENTYLVIDDQSNKALVIDPGMLWERECSQFDKFVSDNQLKLTAIVNTHLHLDHSFGINYVKSKYGVKLYANAGDAKLGLAFDKQVSRFGIRIVQNTSPITIDSPINDNDAISFGDESLRVITTPGHTMGGVSLYNESNKILFSGDTLFKGSIGRTDMEGGDLTTLLSSVKDKIFSLDANVRVLPGHGPSTTVKDEITFNPFIR